MIYLLDTNVIADYLNQDLMKQQFSQVLADGDRLCLCRPVYYEVRRGLLKAHASRKLQILRTTILPALEWIELKKGDWSRAAQLWAELTGKGRQLSDVDLLIAAIAIRHDAVVVTADDDFDALPVKRENWRKI